MDQYLMEIFVYFNKDLFPLHYLIIYRTRSLFITMVSLLSLEVMILYHRLLLLQEPLVVQQLPQQFILISKDIIWQLTTQKNLQF